MTARIFWGPRRKRRCHDGDLTGRTPFRILSPDLDDVDSTGRLRGFRRNPERGLEQSSGGSICSVSLRPFNNLKVITLSWWSVPAMGAELPRRDCLEPAR